MGLFKKLQDGIVDAGKNAADRAQAAMPTDPDAVAAQQRAMGIDTANFGGPSNAPVAADDPIFAPIEGISLEEYARIAKIGTNQGVTDEAGMAAIAAAEGHDAAAWATAVKGWVDRMGQNMAIGQTFRQHYDAAG
jgi:hypothetical protein